jgi:hypothetical protein
MSKIKCCYLVFKSTRSTVVEHSITNLKIEGLNPASARHQEEEIAEKCLEWNSTI